MPIYDYKCRDCDNWEEDVTVTLDELETTVVHCSVCGGDTYRVTHASAVLLKGHCWARDGYSRTYGDKLRHERNK